MKALLSPKKVSLTIIATNLLGRKWSDVSVKLTRVDDYFYHKPKEYDGVTDKEGKVIFKSILEGGYLLQASTKKVVLEELHTIKGNETIKIKLPFIFGLRHKEIKLHGKIVDEFYEKFRTDKEFCFNCKREYHKTLVEAFKCKYCEKYFCPDHRLPENHNCLGEPKAPPGGFREIYAKGRIIATGKGES